MGVCLRRCDLGRRAPEACARNNKYVRGLCIGVLIIGCMAPTEVGVLIVALMRKGEAAPYEVVRVARSRQRRQSVAALAEESGDGAVFFGILLCLVRGWGGWNSPLKSWFSRCNEKIEIRNNAPPGGGGTSALGWSPRGSVHAIPMVSAEGESRDPIHKC